MHLLGLRYNKTTITATVLIKTAVTVKVTNINTAIYLVQFLLAFPLVLQDLQRNMSLLAFMFAIESSSKLRILT